MNDNNHRLQLSVVSESQTNNNNTTTSSSDLRSGDSNSRSDSSHASEQRNPHSAASMLAQSSLQPLVDAASISQGTTNNPFSGMDEATQALLLKALQNQSVEPGNSNAAGTTHQWLVQLLQQQQQLRQQSSAQAAPPPAILAAALTGLSPRGNIAPQQPPPNSPHVVASQASSGTSSSSHHHHHPVPRPPTASHTIEGTPHEQGTEKPGNKRVASRISAQQSRLRKKQYVEELKEENEELRKLRQVLNVIPDLILTFDASGTIRFLTKSSTDFLGMPRDQLIGRSIWDILCPKSVRRLKSAFMDSLASRQPDQESVPLGNRVWDVQLKEPQDPGSLSLLLHGAVHFNGSAPECVCLVRRTFLSKEDTGQEEEERKSETTTTTMTSADQEAASDGNGDGDVEDVNPDETESPPSSSEAVEEHQRPEGKPPSFVQAAGKKQDTSDTSSSMSSGSN